MGRRHIAKKVASGQIKFTRHAYDQMKVRDIFIKQVHDAILNGRVTGKWADREGSRLAIVGKRFNGDSIKIVVKETEPPTIITVCYPYEDL